MNELPSTPAADADLAPVWWRALVRQSMRQRAGRAARIAVGVTVVLAGVSLYLSEHGVRRCETRDDAVVCHEVRFYPFTVQRRSEITTVDGSLQSRREWHPSGHLWIEGDYDIKNGNRVGLWRELYADGTPRFEGVYADDKLVGTETWYFANGNKEWEIGRKDGERDGQERWYRKDGTLRRVGSYKDGARDGTFALFDDDGNAYIRGEYMDGVNISGQAVD